MNSETWYSNERTEVINDLSVFYKRAGKGGSLFGIPAYILIDPTGNIANVKASHSSDNNVM